MRARWPLVCAALLAAWWAMLAIAPNYRSSWLHENLLVFASVPLLFWVHRRALLSNVSWTLVTIAIALHLVGAHYTYSEVPLFDRFKEWFGFSRNHYDRFVHFSYGLLLAYPVRELVMRRAKVDGFWSYFVPLVVIMAASMLYELIEWWFVLIVDPAAGTAFLGAQGDHWDAQKDMALATLGGVLALCFTRARGPLALPR